MRRLMEQPENETDAVYAVVARLRELAELTDIENDRDCLRYAAELMKHQFDEWGADRRLLKKHVGEINRRRGEMSCARDAMKELGETEGTFYQRVKELGMYKRAMESMASQIVHPKTTAKQMAEMQLGKSA